MAPGEKLRKGLVVSHFGRNWWVETGGERYLCYAKRMEEPPRVGDRVLFEETTPGRGRILEVLPRKRVLYRPGKGKRRAVAANVDQLFVVLAPEPPDDLLLLDQILVVCENAGISPKLVFNKIDLLSESSSQEIEKDLKPYLKLYPLFWVSARTGAGLERLQVELQGRVSMLTGQSGVGKSSLLRALVPDLSVRIGDLSPKGTGRHTTTTAMLFHLPEGGAIIDTPGVNVFGLDGIDERALAYGFREFRPYMAKCRFANCHHTNDLGCAVREAVERGEIDRGRYERYLKLRGKFFLTR